MRERFHAVFVERNAFLILDTLAWGAAMVVFIWLFGILVREEAEKQDHTRTMFNVGGCGFFAVMWQRATMILIGLFCDIPDAENARTARGELVPML